MLTTWWRAGLIEIVGRDGVTRYGCIFWLSDAGQSTLEAPGPGQTQAANAENAKEPQVSKAIATTAVALCSVIAMTVGASQTTPGSSSREIDTTVWSAIAATVVADDIVGMGRLYAPDAVLVTPKGTQPIKEALDRWGRDMVAAKGRGDRATVEFRFSLRQDGPTSAFEAGLFKYTVINKAGVSTPQFVPFEALLVKTGGSWRLLMERQFNPATQAEWDKLSK